jgi:hypothetical protein
MRKTIVGALALSWAVSGCALLAPPEPCTTAWYDYEAREAFKPVRRDLRGALNQLQAAQTALQSPDPGLGAAVRIAFAANAGLSVIETIDRESLPRLQAAASTCDDPGFVRRAVFDFLDQEGVDDMFAGTDAATASLGLAPLLEQMLAGSS